jgi:aspartate aminotransferase-like enzyme
MRRVLVVENGVYGERMALISSRYRIAHERVSGSWMDAPDLTVIGSKLDSGKSGERFTHLDALKADGFVIYAGQGDLSKTLFRISTMGDLTSSDIERLAESVARVQRLREA